MTTSSNNHSLAKLIAFIIIIAFIYIVNSNGNTKVPDRPLTKEQKEQQEQKEIKIKKSKKHPVRGTGTIPERVYANTLNSDKFANILTSNKKIIYYSYFADSTDANTFLDDLEKLISQYPEIKTAYDYHLDAREGSASVYCNKVGTTDCIQNYLLQNCSNNLCIINPIKKQILKISNTDYRQAFDKIYQYKNW